MTLLCAGWRHTGLFWIPLQVNVQIADKRQCECFRGVVPLSCAPLRHSVMKYSKLSARNKNLSRKKKKKERDEALCVLRLFFYLQSGLQQRGNGKLKRLAAPAPLLLPSPHLLPPSSPPAWPAEIRRCARWKHRPTPPQLRKHQLCASTPHICLTSHSLSLTYIVNVRAVVSFFKKDQFDMSSCHTHTHTHTESKTRHLSGFSADFQL